MSNLETSDLDCLNLLKQEHGFSDNDLSMLLGIPKKALVSKNMTEKEINSVKLLEAILIKEGYYKPNKSNICSAIKGFRNE